MRKALLITLFAIFAGCSSNPPAPVTDRLPASKPAVSNTTAQTKKPTRPTYKPGDWRPDTYVVKKGDTLFSLGLEYGYYYKDIAQVNKIAPPYNINVGQVLKFSPLKEKTAVVANKPISTTNSDGVEITPINTDGSSTSTVNTGGVATSAANKTATILAINEPKGIREPYSEEALKKPLPPSKSIEKTSATDKPTSATSKPVSATTAATKPEAKPNTEPKANSETKPTTEPNEDIDWAWPTQGKVIAGFNETSNKGLNISGSTGQAINAAASGKIIYSGSDLRGYGKLVIIKHNANYLSVYAHNSLILAKEGQQVSRGQKIAEMGNTDSSAVMLHFEIRRQGKSVDPAKYLSAN